MDKLLKPERLEIDIHSSDIGQQWMHWKRTFENFLEAAKVSKDKDKVNLPVVCSLVAECSDTKETIENVDSESNINDSDEIQEKEWMIQTSINFSDPATWENFDHHQRQTLVENGPVQIVDFPFPLDSNRRKFCVSYYKRNHEKSSDHMSNFQDWKELEFRLGKNKTIDSENLRLIRQEERYWQQVLERLIALVRVLGAQNLAFGGTHEQIFKSDNGNFLKFVEYLALFDPVMHEHLRKIQDKETHIHYLGKEIQNEMIKLLFGAVQKKIVACVRSAKYYSLILDCTPDVSHTEQMTIIIRFVDLIDERGGYIKEHFLGFVPVLETTGAGLTEKILEVLKKLSLPFENLRGQGFDNGSNMKGKNSGVQRRILDKNPRALFVPCSSHSLNLVVNDAA
ncbi:unnamed protein product [Brassicogethes aeneus]|uniref:DUF4371 domain-containing protein n=1 Tax=Brassicogethes aeneus TaxID=1431903 RepID=A0A9P0AZ22_BRAAE|nr:unnamed protein product [Brassicogethes aeneus]